MQIGYSFNEEHTRQLLRSIVYRPEAASVILVQIISLSLGELAYSIAYSDSVHTYTTTSYTNTKC